jgi:hypothetical protein
MSAPQAFLHDPSTRTSANVPGSICIVEDDLPQRGQTNFSTGVVLGSHGQLSDESGHDKGRSMIPRREPSAQGTATTE